MRKAKIIAFANNKGGVGKTTTAMTVAVELARRNHPLLVVDLDAQCSLTESLIDFAPGKTAYDAFIGPKKYEEIMTCIIPGENFVQPIMEMDLLPASKNMKDLEIMLAAKTQREMLLWKIFKAIDVNHIYDYVIIDCPPSLGLMTKNALACCTELYVPTTAEFTPLAGLVKLSDECEEIAEDLNPELKITGIIITRYNSSRNLNLAAEDSLHGTYGDIVFKTRIRENIRIAEAPMQHRDIISYAPESNGAKDYIALVNEIIKRLE